MGPQNALQNSFDIGLRLSFRGKRQIPTSVVGDPGGIIEGIAVGPRRRLFAEVAQDPILLEIPQVSNFPTKRVDDRQARTDHLLVREVIDKVEGSLASFRESAAQLAGGARG